MTYVIYGQATFNNQQRRNAAVNFIRNQATSRNLTARLWGGYVGGTNTVGQTGLTVCYTTDDFNTVELAEAAVNDALQQGGYEGHFGWQDMGLESTQRR